MMPMELCRKICATIAVCKVRTLLCGVLVIFVVLTLYIASHVFAVGKSVHVDGEAVLPESIYTDRKVKQLRYSGDVPLCRAPAIAAHNNRAADGLRSNESLADAAIDCGDGALALLSLDRGVLQWNTAHPLRRNVTRCMVHLFEWAPNNNFREVGQTEVTPPKEDKSGASFRLAADFALARCSYSDLEGATKFLDVSLVQTALSPDVPKRIGEVKRVNKASDFVRRPDVLTVFLGGGAPDTDLDNMPLLTAFFNTILRPLRLDGYNPVGADVESNLFGLLTGKQKEELNSFKGDGTELHYLDNNEFLWYEYERNAYATLLAGTSDLTQNSYGFKHIPVDHYFPTFWSATRGKTQCLGNRPRVSYTFDYLKSFFRTYSNVSKLAIYAHDKHASQFASLSELDKHLVDFLIFLQREDFLNNLVILFVGTPRSNAKSMSTKDVVLQNLAHAYVTVPSWFKRKHVALGKNLIRNSGRLASPYDLHLFLKDVIQADDTDPDPDSFAHRYAVSLLRAFPNDKNCDSSHIPRDWCSCVRSNAVPSGQATSVVAARRAVLQYMNRQIARAKSVCKPLTRLDGVHAYEFVPKTKKTVRRRGGPRYLSGDPDIASYSLRLVLRAVVVTSQRQQQAPRSGRGPVFLAVVEHDKAARTYRVYPHIRRLDVVAGEGGGGAGGGQGGGGGRRSGGSPCHAAAGVAEELRHMCFC